MIAAILLLPPSPNVPAFERDTADVFFQRFTFQSHVVSLFVIYGTTERWDVNILLPFVFTHFKVRAQAVLNDESGTHTHSFDNATKATTEVRSSSDDPVGIGDLLLRTKYHLIDTYGFNLAAGLTLRLPTGNEDDFQSLGDTMTTPFLALSQDANAKAAAVRGNTLSHCRHRRRRFLVTQPCNRVECIAQIFDDILPVFEAEREA